MIEWLVFAVWLALVGYILWFLFKAKTEHPINLSDLALTWKIHKRDTGCRAKRIQNLIVVGKETVGFRCECGYEFVQKRLLSQKVPDASRKTTNQNR